MYNYIVQLIQQWMIWMTIQMMKYLERKFSEFCYFLFIYNSQNFEYRYCMLLCYQNICQWAWLICFPFFSTSDTASVFFMPYMSNDQTTLEYCLKYVNCYICYIFWKQLH